MGASKVYAWLGPAGGGSDWLFEYLDSCRPSPDTFEQNSPDRDDPRVRDVVDTLLHRDYWSRIWIVQEIVMAREVEIMCGSKTIEWDELEVVCRGHDDEPERIFSRLQYARENIGSEDLNLYDAMIRFGQMGCQERHDHVYALLGLVTDYSNQSEESRFAIDYATSNECLYRDVLTFCCPGIDTGFIVSLARTLDLSIDKLSSSDKSNPNAFVLDSYVTVRLPRTGYVEKVVSYIETERLLEGTLSGTSLYPSIEIISHSFPANNTWINEGIGIFFDGRSHHSGSLVYSHFCVNDNANEVRKRVAFISICIEPQTFQSNPSFKPDLCIFLPHTSHELYEGEFSSAPPASPSVAHQDARSALQLLLEHLGEAQFSLEQGTQALNLSLPLRTWLTWFQSNRYIV